MKTVAKAIYAGLYALIGGLVVALTDGELTMVEGLVIAGTVLLAVGTVYQLGPAVVRPGNVQVSQASLEGK